MPVATVLMPTTSGRAAAPSLAWRNGRSKYIESSMPRQAVVPEAGVTGTDSQAPLSKKSFSRPACVQRLVSRRRVVSHDSVGRHEHAAAGSRNTAELRDGLPRVVAVLEHLVAEDDVEAPVADREILDRSCELRPRALHRAAPT